MKLATYAPTKEHSEARSWSKSGHAVRVSWSAYDGAGFQVERHHSTLVLRNGKLKFV